MKICVNKDRILSWTFNVRNNEIIGNTKSKITKDENGENVPNLEIPEVILVHCNIVNNDCQLHSRILYRFVPNKVFGQLLDNTLQNFLFLKALDSQFLYIEVWFTDKNHKTLQIEDKININLNIT